MCVQCYLICISTTVTPTFSAYRTWVCTMFYLKTINFHIRFIIAVDISAEQTLTACVLRYVYHDLTAHKLTPAKRDVITVVIDKLVTLDCANTILHRVSKKCSLLNLLQREETLTNVHNFWQVISW